MIERGEGLLVAYRIARAAGIDVRLLDRLEGDDRLPRHLRFPPVGSNSRISATASQLATSLQSADESRQPAARWRIVWGGRQRVHGRHERRIAGCLPAQVQRVHERMGAPVAVYAGAGRIGRGLPAASPIEKPLALFQQRRVFARRRPPVKGATPSSGAKP